MFVIGSAIRYVAFDNPLVWVEAAPEAALWATGIFFTLAVSASNFLERRAVPRMEPDAEGTGFRVKYEVVLPQDLRPSQKFLYMFLIAITVWIVDVLLVGSALKSYDTTQRFELLFMVCVATSFSITAFVIVLALRSIREVLR